jgi:hypothetical protein
MLKGTTSRRRRNSSRLLSMSRRRRLRRLLAARKEFVPVRRDAFLLSEIVARRPEVVRALS